MIKNKELFKDVVGYEGSYSVSNMGVVKSLPRTIIRKDDVSTKLNGKVLNYNINRKGYLMVKISINANSRYMTVHRLVAIAFIPNPNNHPQVNHIDGVKTNNFVNNLEWCTNEYNMQHAIENGLMNFDSAKLQVSQFSLDGVFIKTFKSIRQASEETNTTHSGISMCSRGLYNYYSGFIWRLGNEMDNPDVKPHSGNQCKPVNQYDLDGNFIKRYPSQKVASNFGFKRANISLCCNGKQDNHKGYKWSYAVEENEVVSPYNKEVK